MAGKPVSQSSKNLGMRMKNILKELKISQEAAAFRLGLPYQSSLNHYLSGRSEIPVNLIEKFQREFNIPVNVLMDSENFACFSYSPERLSIMQSMDDYLNANHLQMKVENKTKLVELFYKEKTNSREIIFTAMSAMQFANPTIFEKNKN